MPHKCQTVKFSPLGCSLPYPHAVGFRFLSHEHFKPGSILIKIVLLFKLFNGFSSLIQIAHKQLLKLWEILQVPGGAMAE